MDLALILQRAKNKKTLLWAGGRWDRTDQHYVEEEPTNGKVILLEDSQIEFVEWYAQWLAAYRDGQPRDISVVMAAGARRGGKTFCTVACVLAAAIDVPGSICWLVAKSFSEVKELNERVTTMLPRAWYRYRGAPRYEFTLANGSTITVESADDPERLKKGRADLVLLNESQKVDVGAFVNSFGGTIDNGGLVLLAANPPRRVIGQWVLDFKELVESGKIPGCKVFGFDSALNTQIDHGSKKRYRDIVVALDPKSALADADGGWFPIGDAAYPNFETQKHLKPVPQIGQDITREVTRRKVGREYDTVGGADFQKVPYHASVTVKVFRGMDGKSVYYAIGEHFGHGTEDDLLDEIDKARLTPDKHMFVGDSSGSWQDGEHKKGRRSFDVFRARRWHIVGPQRKRSSQGEFASNPAIEDRLSLVNGLLAGNRLFVDADRCPKLAAALKKCELRRGKPYGNYAHVTDALGYVLFFLEPRVGSPSDGPRSDAWSVLSAKRTIDW